MHGIFCLQSDLKVVNDAKGGSFYRDHLPQLGMLFRRSVGLNPFRLSYVYNTYKVPKPLRLLFVNMRTRTGIKIWGLLTDTLRYLQHELDT